MKNIFDDQTLDIPCPHCGQKSTERVARLKENPTLTCTGCGNHIKIDADELRNATDALQKQLDAIFRGLK